MSRSIPYRVRAELSYADGTWGVAERIYFAQTPSLAKAHMLRYYRHKLRNFGITITKVAPADQSEVVNAQA